MSSPLLARSPLANLASNAAKCSFSTSSRLAAAAEVKRLGVIGAGQMVGIWSIMNGHHWKKMTDSRRSGFGHCARSSTKGQSPSDSSG